MNTVKTMQNMSQVVDKIQADTPFTPAFQKKVLGSVRRMARMPEYGVPLEQIPADLEHFERMWSRGSVRGLPSSFKSKKAFSDWRSQVRSALMAALEVKATVKKKKIEDGWSQLADDLLKAGVAEKKLISLSVLAEAARVASLQPAQISRQWLQHLIDTCDTSGKYRAVQDAIRLLHKHHEDVTLDISPAINGFPVKKSRTYCVRARLPESLAAEVTAWQSERLKGETRGVRLKRKSACSPKRAKQALRGVTYVYTAMLEANLVQPGSLCNSKDLAAPELLEEVIENELNNRFPWNPLAPTTLFEYVNNWKLFLKGCGHDTTFLTELIRDFEAFENVKSMSASRRAWCEGFLKDHHKQSAFLSLPENLFQAAKKEMHVYETGSHHQKQSAIALGVAACAAAIWTSLPLRISTLLKLTYGGPKADIQIHGAKRGLIVTTPPDIVKNGYSHQYISLLPKRGGDPRAIVEWFTQIVRPRLLEAHIAPHLRRDDLLFGGIAPARLSSIWRRETLAAGIPMTPHQVRHALATLMANQPKADYAIIAALLGDTEATVRRNYVFVDQARLHAEGQKILSQIQSHVLMRGV